MELRVKFSTLEELRVKLAEFRFEGHTIDIAPTEPLQEFSQEVKDRMKAEALHAQALVREALQREQANIVAPTPPAETYQAMTGGQEIPGTTWEQQRAADIEGVHAISQTIPQDPNAIDLSKIDTVEELEALDTTGMSPGKKSAITKRKKAIQAQNEPAPTAEIPTPGGIAHPTGEIPTPGGMGHPAQQTPAPIPTPAQTTLPRDQWPPFDLVAQDGTGRGAWYAHNAPAGGVATIYDPGTNTLAPTGEAYSIADQLAAANANDPSAILTAPPIAEPQAPAQQAAQVNGEVDQATRMDFIRKVATDGRVPEAQAKAIEMFGPGKGVNTLTGPELTHFMAWYNGGAQ